MDEIIVRDPFGFMGLTKKEVKARAQGLAKSITELGEQNPLETYIMAGKAKDAFAALQENLHDDARAEALRHGKSHKQHNTRVEVKDAGVTWDYSNCGDTELARLQEEFDKAKQALEERKAFLRTLQKPLTTLDEDTGNVETIHPPVRKATEKLTITY